MDKVSFIGYSGHAFVCIDSAIRMGFEVDGYYDFEEKEVNPYHLGYKGLESNHDGLSRLFVAIGDNTIRKKVFTSLENSNELINIIDPTAICSKMSQLGKGVFISAGAAVNSLSSIGDGVIINTGAVVEHECEISNFAHICPGAVLAGNVKIGELSFIGSNSTVIQGVQICNNVIIGAGSTVVRDIKEPGVYVGTPAKKIK